MTETETLTVAQALIRFLAAQHVERDGRRERFFAGCLGIFGHGNVAGLGQALAQYEDLLPYHPARNEQAMVHVAAGYARQRNRLGAWACTTSVGPGATNLVTGAALATINRLPVLLLPGDTFATRYPHPVLQQLEVPHDATVSVNDCLRPGVALLRAGRAPRAAHPRCAGGHAGPHRPGRDGRGDAGPARGRAGRGLRGAGRVPGAAHLDAVPAAACRRRASAAAAQLVRGAQRPLIVAGGGVIYSEATAALRAFVDATGIPVAETQAGRGALVSGHPLSLGAIGATGTAAANRLAREADVVIGIGTRWSDFTTASKSAFQDPGVRFVNVNVTSFDAAKLSGVAVVADARVALDELLARSRRPPRRPRVGAPGRRAERRLGERGDAAGLAHPGEGLPSQAQVIGAINDAAGETGVVVCAAGSAPGDLHKLWRARDPAGKGYHVEYGYSCMGYEIPGGMGVKLAAPEREVFVLIGDGSYLMLPGELVTAVAERIAIVIVLVDNHGYASIGALSRSVGSAGFGTHYRFAANGSLPVDDAAGGALAQPTGSDVLPIDLAANAESLGARVVRARTIDDLRAALAEAAGRRLRRPDRGVHRDRPLRRGPELRRLVGRARGGDVDAGDRARRPRGVRAQRIRPTTIPGVSL